MKFYIGQAVEVRDEQGTWSKAIIRTSNGDNKYQVTYPSWGKATIPIEGVFWWSERRMRAVAR